MKSAYTYQVSDVVRTVTIEQKGDRFQITVDDNVYDVTVSRAQPDTLYFTVDGQRLRAYVAHEDDRRFVAVAGEHWTLERLPSARSQPRQSTATADVGAGVLQATMPGLVLDVLVTEGDEVTRGQTLVVLEAMKMELRVTAPHAGRVDHVHCAAGQIVERGQLLIEITAASSPIPPPDPD